MLVWAVGAGDVVVERTNRPFSQALHVGCFRGDWDAVEVYAGGNLVPVAPPAPRSCIGTTGILPVLLWFLNPLRLHDRVARTTLLAAPQKLHAPHPAPHQPRRAQHGSNYRSYATLVRCCQQSFVRGRGFIEQQLDRFEDCDGLAVGAAVQVVDEEHKPARQCTCVVDISVGSRGANIFNSLDGTLRITTPFLYCRMAYGFYSRHAAATAIVTVVQR